MKHKNDFFDNKYMTTGRITRSNKRYYIVRWANGSESILRQDDLREKIGSRRYFNRYRVFN